MRLAMRAEGRDEPDPARERKAARPSVKGRWRLAANRVGIQAIDRSRNAGCGAIEHSLQAGHVAL